jgi:putative two-component system response regulator
MEMTDRVLVIEDEEVVRSLIVEVLEDAGYDVMQADRAERGLELIADDTPSVVISDIVMPGLSGLELLESVRGSHPSLPVVLVTGAGTYGNLTRALSYGASGVVVKPFSHSDLVNAVRAALKRATAAENEMRQRLVTPTVAAALANAIEARDVGVHGHCERLAELALRIAAAFDLDSVETEVVRLGALLHDVGKIGIPDRVLLKPGLLKVKERELIRTHPLIGDNLLSAFEPLLEVRDVVRHHHERWDGTGYPDGLAGEDISLAARIVAVADSVEAMCAQRPYRDPLTSDAILQELATGRGTQWDPTVVDVVLGLIESGSLQVGVEGLWLGPPDGAEQNGYRHSVLLVEDDEDLAALVAETIRRAVTDVRVIHAPDMASAETLFAGRSWSLAVLDHKLPDGSGLDLLERLRIVDPHMPVLMMTGEGSERVAVEAFRRGASDYVVKGEGTLLELQTRIRALLVV